jgi:hypothetical protein
MPNCQRFFLPLLVLLVRMENSATPLCRRMADPMHLELKELCLPKQANTVQGTHSFNQWDGIEEDMGVLQYERGAYC